MPDEEKGFGPSSQMKGIEEMAPDNSPGAHGEVGLTGTSATADCRACACASRVGRVVEVVRLAPHERVQQRTAEQIVEVPQFSEETVEMVSSAPRERVHHRTAEHSERWSKKPTFVFLRWRKKLSRFASCHRSASGSAPRSASTRASWS